jgi:hypothetical protein
MAGHPLIVLAIARVLVVASDPDGITGRLRRHAFLWLGGRHRWWLRHETTVRARGGWRNGVVRRALFAVTTVAVGATRDTTGRRTDGCAEQGMMSAAAYVVTNDRAAKGAEGGAGCGAPFCAGAGARAARAKRDRRERN